MAEPLTISDFAALQEYAGDCGPSKVRFENGELAIDMIGHATAEELLAALRGLVGVDTAKAIVELLLENSLTFDDTIESELAHAG